MALWQHVVENTGRRCHLLLSNIIGLEGPMPGILPRTAERTHAGEVWRSVEFIIRPVSAPVKINIHVLFMGGKMLLEPKVQKHEEINQLP